ncbi:hypothetical protein [Gymnodinialimonas ulvae]|uniref:hypothetical protein n=1 Tax=Gymnodinialimonas ulvae TaxID=3126504 RepID=UPI0030AD4930
MTNLSLRAACLAALLTIPATAAVAQSALDRFEAASERVTQLTYQGIAAQYSVDASVFPDTAWDRPMRRAGRCILDAYESEVGSDGVAQFLTGFETALQSAAPADILNGSFSGQLPEGLTTQRQQQIQNECGMLELEMTRLATSGVLQALQQQ